MKKLLALLLALVLALAVGAPALADYPVQTVEAVAGDYTGKTIILHSNDVHGAIEGYACIPTLRETFKALGASDVIVVDSGDFSQGSIYVSINKGASAIDMMNAAGYDIITLGNHEFDFGYAQLMDNLSKASFTVISADQGIAGPGAGYPGAQRKPRRNRDPRAGRRRRRHGRFRLHRT